VTDGGRERRIAENEVVFRRANETLWGVYDDAEGAPLDGYPFLRERGDRNCTAVVQVPLEIYEQIREHPARFLTLPGYKQLPSEEIIDRGDGYDVVEKTGAAGALARARWTGFITTTDA
jgi:hypothetical protein